VWGSKDKTRIQAVDQIGRRKKLYTRDGDIDLGGRGERTPHLEDEKTVHFWMAKEKNKTPYSPANILLLEKRSGHLYEGDAAGGGKVKKSVTSDRSQSTSKRKETRDDLSTASLTQLMLVKKEDKPRAPKLTVLPKEEELSMSRTGVPPPPKNE